MKNIVALLTIFLTLVSGSLALAQSTGDLGTMLGDVLGGLLSGRQGNETRSWHGHLVQARGTTTIFRAEDGKVYAVDMSAIDTETWHPIVLGQAVTLAAKPGHEANTLVAVRLQTDPADRSTGKAPKKPFVSTQGTVEAMQESRYRVREHDGHSRWWDH